jgi:hypothetical protein
VVNRRSFSGLLTAIAVASAIPGIVQAQDTPVAQIVVLVHGLYAHGSVRAPAYDSVAPSFLQPLDNPVPMVATADIVRPDSRNLSIESPDDHAAQK